MQWLSCFSVGGMIAAAMGTVGMAKPPEEIWEQKEALEKWPWHELSLSLWHWQSWAAVPIWAVVHIWTGVHIWAVVPLGCCCRQSPAFAHSSGSNQGQDVGRLRAA